MSAQVIFPSPLYAGDSWDIEASASTYDSDYGYTITLASGSNKIATSGAYTSAKVSFHFSATETAPLPAGPYAYTVAASSGENRYTYLTGGVPVIADISTTPIVDGSTTYQKMLAACDETLLKLLSRTVTQTQFGGKSYTLVNIAELWQVRNELQSRVDDELAKLMGNRRNSMIVPVYVDHVCFFYYPWGGGGW